LTDLSLFDTMSPESKKLYSKLQNALRDTITPCVVAGPEFYADYPDGIDVDTAEEMCYGCPLLKLCYDYAVSDNVEVGIWGGVNFTKQEEEINGL
jgi:Transcription factor WhiB